MKKKKIIVKPTAKEKAVFSKELAKSIADKNFGYVLDCILGYSDSEYTLKDDSETFEQNFEEDLEESGINVTTYKIKVISAQYDKIAEDFKKYVRKKYYN